MALAKCPECGNEISTEAKSCPNCGYVLSDKQNGNKKTGIIILIAVILAIVVIGIVIALVVVPKIKEKNEESANAEMYEEALDLVEKGKIEEAKELFEELEGYEDSEEYLEKLTSRITDVSDQGYYNACVVVEMCKDSSYRDEIISELEKINEENEFYSSSGKEISIETVEDAYKVADAIKEDEFFKDLYSRIDAIDCDGKEDELLRDYVEGYVNLLIDNLWSENIEKDNGDTYEISFAAMANIYVFISDDDLMKQGLEMMGLDVTEIEKLLDFEDAIKSFEKEFDTAIDMDDISSFSWKLSTLTMFNNLTD